MNNEAGAQPCGVDVGAAAEITRPEVCVHVLIVSLEEANRQVMIEERHLIVHAAAHREIVTPLVGIEIRAVYLRRSYQPMDKRCNVSARETRDQMARRGRALLGLKYGLFTCAVPTSPWINGVMFPLGKRAIKPPATVRKPSSFPCVPMLEPLADRKST